MSNSTIIYDYPSPSDLRLTIDFLMIGRKSSFNVCFILVRLLIVFGELSCSKHTSIVHLFVQKFFRKPTIRSNKTISDKSYILFYSFLLPRGLISVNLFNSFLFLKYFLNVVKTLNKEMWLNEGKGIFKFWLNLNLLETLLRVCQSPTKHQIIINGARVPTD